MKLTTAQCKQVVANIREDLKAYLIDSKLKSLVIGVSGGIDSAVCCALARPVCDELNVKLIGRSLPIKTNKVDEINRARAIGEAFCHDFKEVDLADSYDAANDLIMAHEGVCDDPKVEAIRKGNIKARTRMIYLYNLAYATGGMGLSTDNLTEYNLSFFSLHGDVFDYGSIQNLWKHEVYAISKYIVLEDDTCALLQNHHALVSCICAIPTDGLGITSSDVEQLEVKDYDEADSILQPWVDEKIGDVNHPIIQRHIRTEFKRNNPYNIPRDILLKGI